MENTIGNFYYDLNVNFTFKGFNLNFKKFIAIFNIFELDCTFYLQTHFDC